MYIYIGIISQEADKKLTTPNKPLINTPPIHKGKRELTEKFN